MSSPPDLRFGRLSLTILIVLSGLATFVILSAGGQRTPAETAALAALHERPRSPTIVAAAPATPANTAATPTGTPSASAAAGDSSSDPAPSTSAATGDTGSTTPTSDGNANSAGDSNNSQTTTTPVVNNLPKIGHVFEIALSTTSYKAAFGPHGAAYLRSLEGKGALLPGYRSLGSSELADNVAMIGGQAPNPDTRGGCTTYAEFPTAVVAKANGLVPGLGCVYPETALTIGDQVSSSGHVWRAYIEDQGKQTCVHANSGAVDDVPLPGSDPGYDSRHNPFVYFHSLLDLGDCSTDDLDLSKLPAALSATAKTATFSFLAPSACGDARAIADSASGNDRSSTAPTTTTSTTTSTTPTANTTTGSTPSASSSSPSALTTTTTGTATTPATVPTTAISGAFGSPTAAACPAGPVGLANENAFLKRWVPLILRSAAYKKDGVLIIAFSGAGAQRSGPKVATGALVLSRYARRGKRVATAYSPYSLLHSVEDMLRYTPLAKAKAAPSFASATLSKLQ